MLFALAFVAIILSGCKKDSSGGSSSSGYAPKDVTGMKMSMDWNSLVMIFSSNNSCTFDMHYVSGGTCSYKKTGDYSATINITTYPKDLQDIFDRNEYEFSLIFLTPNQGTFSGNSTYYYTDGTAPTVQYITNKTFTIF